MRRRPRGTRHPHRAAHRALRADPPGGPRRLPAAARPARAGPPLGPGHTVLVRTHYFHTGGAGDLTAGPDAARIVDVSDHPVVEDLYLAADALVTDYSSMMFDYAVLDRPITLFAPDWDEYRAVRGVYFDLLAEPPGAVATTTGQAADALLAGDPDPQLRARFRERFCPWDDGHAAERVVREVFPSGAQATAPDRRVLTA
ncbi:CDP-glycerol glycerophosphotransferase family protein [Kitasatospora arboriphila]